MNALSDVWHENNTICKHRMPMNINANHLYSKCVGFLATIPKTLEMCEDI